MNPNLLKQLAIIVNQGSISRACEQLHLTQPTLTRSMKQLEMKVGASLLKRSRYGVVPTEIGQRLAKIGEKILAETQYSDEIIRQFHSGYQNEFILGLDPLWEIATVSHLVPALIAETKLVFHLRTSSAANQIELLQKKELDFLIAPAYLAVKQKGLQKKIIFRDREGIFAGKQSKLLRAREPLTLDSIANEQWIIAGAKAGFLKTLNKKAARISLTGSFNTLFYLLENTSMLVKLPIRLALLTGKISSEQLLDLTDFNPARRDFALWSRLSTDEHPASLKVSELLYATLSELDNSLPLFNQHF